MARYSRRTGPVANFELTTTESDIPGLSITRFFDAGEVLLSYLVNVTNTIGFSLNLKAQIHIDGVSLYTRRPELSIANGSQGFISDSHLVTLTTGIHTIKLRAEGFNAVGDIVRADGSHLSLVQLPKWDQDTDIL